MKRIFDILFASIGLLIFILPLLLFGLLIKLSSKGPIIHWSHRVGVRNRVFRMAKLRTMKNGTPVLSSNHFHMPEKYLIRFGKIFREFGFDEIPQLYNILKGEMSFVGPRPLVLDDREIISLRNVKGVNNIRPGLTGLAQINGRNGMAIPEKVKYDELYMKNMCMLLDLKILVLTNYTMLCQNILRRRINTSMIMRLV